MLNLIRLDELSPLDIALAGGKATNLASLLQAGFPVPTGFVLSSEAYRAFIKATGLESKVREVVRQAAEMSTTELEEAAGELAQAFVTAEMPETIAEALREAYAALGEGPVAVRSTATSEDLPEASFAGQQATYLNVLGEEDLFSAVTLCWASLWSARALAYRVHIGALSEEITLAVIVQKMVRAEAAGVLFTANPTTRDPDEMLVNATQGYGEAVGTGEVTPDEVHIDRNSWTVSRSETHGPALIPNEAYLELARLGERIEFHFGVPQDIEWAWSEGDFFILQARPITTPLLPRLRWDPPQPGSIYTREGVMDLLQDPVSALFETVGLTALEKASQACDDEYQCYATINGYVYLRVRAKPKHPKGILLGRVFGSKPGETARVDLLQTYRQAVDTLRGDPATLKARELMGRISALALACAQYWTEAARVIAEGEQVERAFITLYQKIKQPGDAEVGVLLRSQKNRPLEAETALYESRKGELDDYVREYGHMLFNFDFAVPLAGEDCCAFEANLRAWEQGAPSPAERQAALAKEQRAAEERIHARLTAPAKRRFDQALADAQAAARDRENALFDLGLAWAPLRGYALELGRRLKAAGVFEQAEQVFWLRWNELGVLAAALDEGKQRLPSQALKAMAREDASRAAREAKAPLMVPEPSNAVGTKREEHTAEAEGALTGAAASPGRVTGVARIIRNSVEFERLGRGEILVTRATTPAWTPLFAIAAGLVADLGGALSHGSTVAREYGIPAVMGTGDATARIEDGQVITVDGTKGIVYLVEP